MQMSKIEMIYLCMEYKLYASGIIFMPSVWVVACRCTKLHLKNVLCEEIIQILWIKQAKAFQELSSIFCGCFHVRVILIPNIIVWHGTEPFICRSHIFKGLFFYICRSHQWYFLHLDHRSHTGLRSPSIYSDPNPPVHRSPSDHAASSNLAPSSVCNRLLGSTALTSTVSNHGARIPAI